MSEPFIRPVSDRLKPLLIGGLLGFAIIAAALVILIGYQYSQYRATGGELLQPDPGQITIRLAKSASFVAGSPVMVPVSAVGYEPFLSAELWVDGALAGVDAAPSGGATPFDADFTWIPTQPGVHQIIARAIDSSQRVASSAAVLVLVLPDEALAEGSEDEAAEPETDGGGASPVVFPAAPAGAAQTPIPPGSDDAVGESQPWQGSPGDWINNLTTDSAPTTPEIIGKPFGCGANIFIRDLSDNEEGFHVYRQGLNASAWSQIATLASQDQDEWIKFTDEGVFGPTSYYVSAFNSQGEATSNIVMAHIPADADNPCLPEDQANDLPVLTVELANLFPKLETEQSYCYQSIGGMLWSRLPEDGFYTPGEAGLQIDKAVSQLLLSDPDGQPLFENLDLYLECWGWSGGELQFLGKSVQTIDLSNPNDVQIDLGSISAEVLVDILNLSDLNFDLPVDMIPVEEPFFDPEIAKKFIYNFASTAQMPFIAAWLSYDPDVCTTYLEQEAQNVLGSLLLCQPYPSFNIGPGGANPQPYIVWLLLDNTCPAGFNEECRPFSFWQKLAESRGANIRWNIDHETPKAGYDFSVEHPLRHVYVSGNYNCSNGYNVIKVQMQVLDPDGPDFNGPWSNWVAVPCGSEISDSVFIEVSFESIHLNNLEDGDSDSTGCIGPESCDDIEVYGRFGARSWPTNTRSFVHVGQNPDYYNGCWNPEDYQADLEQGTLGCVQDWAFGTKNLASEGLCVATESQSVNWDHWSHCFNEWANFNNKIIIPVQNGSDIKLAADLYDHDVSSGHDAACVTHLWTDTKTLMQWAQTTNEVYTLSADHANADCEVKIILNAVTP